MHQSHTAPDAVTLPPRSAVTVTLHALFVAQVVGGGPALFHMAGPAVAYAYVALMLIPAAVSIQRAAFILWGIHDA